MSSNDLFSFLDETVPEVPEAGTSSNGHADSMDTRTDQDLGSPNTRQLKRKADAVESSVPTQENGDVSMSDHRDPSPAPSFKKPRMASPQPIVLDSVEIEAKREVAASAGLTGGVEAGSRLELKHQVRCNLK